MCVLIVTRISYTAPAVCDEYLLRPFAWAAFALDNETRDGRMGTSSGSARHGSSGSGMICDAQQVFKSAAFLNALATLCPLQPPLVTALSRSGVGEAATMLCIQMLLQIPSAVCSVGRAAVAAANASSCITPSEQTLRPLALLMDFCFQYWTNMAASTSSLEELARQIVCVMLRSPAHCFVYDQQGNIGIYRRDLDSDMKAWNAPIIDSPQQLLSALATMEERQSTSEKKDCLNSNDSNDDPGRDLRELLALAAKFARMGVNTATGVTGENTAATSSSSSSSSNYVAQLLKTLPQQAAEDIQDDDDGVSGAAIAGQNLVDVGSRAQAVAELLLLYEEHQEQKQQQPPPQRSKDDIDPDSSSDSKAAVASEVFLRCLRSFLGNQSTSACTSSTTSSCGDNMTHEQEVTMMQRGLSGLALMTFQSLVPMSILLKNGAKVIEIVAAFVEAHAAGLDRPLADREYEMSPLVGHTDVDTSTSSRPLIHVISSTDSSISSEEACNEEAAGGGDLEILSCALSILTALLGLGSGEKRSAREETALRCLLRPLQIIAFKDPDEERARAASDSTLLLLNRFTSSCTVENEKSARIHPYPQEQSQSAFATVVASAKNDLFSSKEAPMRAMGVHAITFAMKDPATTVRLMSRLYPVNVLILFFILSLFVQSHSHSVMMTLNWLCRHCFHYSWIPTLSCICTY